MGLAVCVCVFVLLCVRESVSTLWPQWAGLVAPWDPSRSIQHSVHNAPVPRNTVATWDNVAGWHGFPASHTPSRRWDPRSCGTYDSLPPVPCSRARRCAHGTWTSEWASVRWPFLAGISARNSEKEQNGSKYQDF